MTILVNGLPLVHCELKRRGVAIREAFNQIKRYQRDSFWAASGLYEYVQIFVISNGTNTKYYSNTTRSSHIKETANSSAKSNGKKTSNSFEFTSFWADASNKIISDLVDFTKTFFAKHTLLNILTKYCVFTTEDLLLVMRPYQIAATERILNRIEVSANYKKYGTTDGGGYIWHTTGSGKTLTSFKTAQLATALPYIDKVLFVVDRKDLDYQTIKEYDRFQKGAADGNTSTRVLQKQLEDENSKIIITTIQKLSTFISRNKTHSVYSKHIVMIFDECHRSQFGDMHIAITKSFKKYHLFGFTGTPIFPVNSSSGKPLNLRTTEQAFGDRLHTYTIVDAINDGNVLPFRVDYIDTVRMADNVTDKQVRAIDIEKAMNAPKRITEIVTYIIDHFDQKTKRNSFYSLKGQRVAGFNSILAVSSIPAAKLYYNEFQKQLKERRKSLTVATIFSFSANEADPDDVLADESFDTDSLDQTSRDFLDSSIKDYNKVFNTNFDTSADKFQNYYKDLSMRVKQREVDLLIVVNMFLTGFDATTLNTLWVDKNLKMHGLIQAFSRTNRILNSVKTYGNIVCFRDLQDEVNAAIALFGDKDAGGIVLMKTYDEYMNGYENDKGVFHIGYIDLVRELQDKFPIGAPIEGEQAQKEFIRLYGAVLRLRNILLSFDKFEGQDALTDRDRQDYQSIYIDLYQELSPKADGEKENINADIVFELELIKQVDINIDYILMLVAQYHDGNCEDKQIIAAIDRAINASIELRSKKELIQGFINSVNVDTDVRKDWTSYISEQREKDIEEIIREQRLDPDKTRKFINNSFRDGYIKTTGVELDRIMPPMSIFDTDRQKTTQGIIERLKGFFNKYFGIE